MAVASVRNIFRMPGRLVKDPTDLSATFPYGGTALGIYRSLMFQTNERHRALRAEEWGNQTIEVLDGGSSPIMAATLRSWDNDALSALFLDTAAGGTSGDRVVQKRVSTNDRRAGFKLGEKEFALLFVPEAVIRHPAILLYAAVPVISDDTEIALSMQSEIGVPVLFYCRPDSNDRVWYMGKLVDLSL